jgi:hypothetical protein
VRRRRCLIPADGYYEWSGAAGRKQAYQVTRAGNRPFAFADAGYVHPGQKVAIKFDTFLTSNTAWLRGRSASSARIASMAGQETQRGSVATQGDEETLEHGNSTPISGQSCLICKRRSSSARWRCSTAAEDLPSNRMALAFLRLASIRLMLRKPFNPPRGFRTDSY